MAHSCHEAHTWLNHHDMVVVNTMSLGVTRQTVPIVQKSHLAGENCLVKR